MIDLDEYARNHHAEHVRLAYLLLGDVHDAEDAVQNVYASLSRRWLSLNITQSTDVYVRGAVVKACAGQKRRRARRREFIGNVPDRAANDQDVADRLTLMRLLARLPPRQRAIMVLRYYEDRTESEIAAILGCGTGTVKSQASKARDSLREGWLSSSGELPRSTGSR